MENKAQRAVYIEDSIWNKARLKAQEPHIDRSLSQIIRRLLEMWLNGEVIPYPESNINDGKTNT